MQAWDAGPQTVAAFMSAVTPGPADEVAAGQTITVQTPGGDATALKLAGVSFALALAALLASEFLTRQAHRMVGR